MFFQRSAYFLGIMTLLWSCLSEAAYSNYNTILVGGQAAGMGGAYTALTGDPSAVSYYNPAGLARMQGTSLSASANVYYKPDTLYGQADEFTQAPLRINRGFFRSIPVSSGSVHNFGPFAIGLSIVVPDYEYYSGEVVAKDKNTSYLNLLDESLWVGGALGLNLTKKDSVGLTIYYTARNMTRSVSDESRTGAGNATKITIASAG